MLACRCLIVTLLGLHSTALFAADWTLNPATSRVEFHSSLNGDAFKGEFTTFRAHLALSETNLLEKIDLQFPLQESITGDAQRDAALHDLPFFNIAQFPEATFTSSDIQQNNGQATIKGILQINGIQLPATVSSSVQVSETIVLQGSAQIERLRFQVGSGDFADFSTIPAVVEVEFTLTFSQTTDQH